MKTGLALQVLLVMSAPSFGQDARDEWESRHSLMPTELMQPDQASGRAPPVEARSDAAGPLVAAPVARPEPVVMKPVQKAAAQEAKPKPEQEQEQKQEPAAKPEPKPESKPEPFRMKGLDEMPPDEVVAGGEFDAATEAAKLVVPAEPRIILRRLDPSRNYFEDEKPEPAKAPKPAKAKTKSKATPERLIAPAPISGPRLHAASYNTRETAESGIPKLKSEYPVLAPFAASVSYERAGSLGYFWRVYFSGPAPELKKACAALKKSGKWCSIVG